MCFSYLAYKSEWTLILNIIGSFIFCVFILPYILKINLNGKKLKKINFIFMELLFLIIPNSLLFFGSGETPIIKLLIPFFISTCCAISISRQCKDEIYRNIKEVRYYNKLFLVVFSILYSLYCYFFNKDYYVLAFTLVFITPFLVMDLLLDRIEISIQVKGQNGN